MIAHEGFWFGPGWGVVAGLLSVAFWVLVVVIIASFVRSRPVGGGGRSPSALRVLEERYARGEISRKEFAERRQVLLGEAPPEG
ncbi:MAG: SHOCT domain-containing protein [Actinomycetota bacterium]